MGPQVTEVLQQFIRKDFRYLFCFVKKKKTIILLSQLEKEDEDEDDDGALTVRAGSSQTILQVH